MEHKFTQSNDLIKMVITRQAGDYRKGILEAVQNAYDSMLRVSKKIPIEIELNGFTLSITDLGNGFKSIEEFQLFGRDADKGIGKTNKELGEFHIGRGQIISMAQEIGGGVRDIEFLTTIKGKKVKIHNININDLSFEVTEMYHGVQGTKVIVRNSKFAPHEIKIYIESRLRFFERPISFNGDIITEKATKKEVKSKYLLDLDHAKVFINDWGDGFDLYNKGIHVSSYNLCDGFSGHVVTKTNLTLNFARNDVISGDMRWHLIKKGIEKFCVEKALGKKKLSEDQKYFLLEKARNNSNILERIKDKKLIKLSNGKFISINELDGGSVYASDNPESRMEDKAIQSGFNVIVMNYDIRNLLEQCDIEVKKFSRCPISGEEYKVFDPNQYTNKHKEIIEEIGKFCSKRKIKFGNSDWARAWTDGSSYVVFNVNSFNLDEWDSNRNVVLWNLIQTLAHELAHDDSDMNSDIHGYKFEENNRKQLERLGRIYSLRMNGGGNESGKQFEAKIYKQKAGNGQPLVRITIPREIVKELDLLSAEKITGEIKKVAKLNWN